LAFGQHRNGAEAVPILATVRNGYRRESYMPNHFPVNFRDQGNSESIGGSQRINYKVFCLITDGMILKSRFGDTSDCSNIRLRFIPYNHIEFQFTLHKRFLTKISLFPLPQEPISLRSGTSGSAHLGKVYHKAAEFYHWNL
jgi:hypothetical protein